MTHSETVGLVIFGCILLGYIITLRLLLEMARPYRERMYEIGCRLLDSGKLTSRQEEHVAALLDTAFSTRAAAMISVAVVAVFFDLLLGRKSQSDALDPLQRDAEFHRFIGLYLVSIAAANPLVTVALAPFVGGTMLVAALRGRSAREAVEAPALIITDPRNVAA